MNALHRPEGWFAPGGQDVQSRSLRRALGGYATGVAVIGARGADGSLVGTTMNSFVSLSLAPPLVAFAPARALSAASIYCAAASFSVSVLGEAQQAISALFASTGVDKWASVPHVFAPSGAPMLADAIATFDCRVVQSIEAGDHFLVIGEILHYRVDAKGRPLIFWGGRYREVSPEPAPGAPGEAEAYLLGWGL